MIVLVVVLAALSSVLDAATCGAEGDSEGAGE